MPDIMPNQISNVGFGSPYAAEQMDIQRKQKLAQLLQQQAMSPIEQGATPAGGFTPRTSPLQGLAKIMQGYVGQQREKGAQTQQTELAQRMQQERQQALAQAMMQGQGSPQPAPEQGGGPAMPPNPMGAAQSLAGANDPALQQAGVSMIGKQMEAQMPKRPEPYTLTPGGQRRGLNNELLATAPPNPQQPRAPQIIQTANGPMMLNEQGQAVPIPGPGGSPVQAPKKEPLVSVDMKGEGEYFKTVGKQSGERDMGQHDAAIAAIDNITKLDLTLKQITESSAITGMGSDVLKNIERAKVLVMRDQAAGKKVSDTELLDALLGSDVFPMIKALGIGARGLDTPAEREFLRNVMTGTTPMNRETLRRMTEIRRDVAKRSIERWNERVEGGELDRYFQATGMPKRKIEMPKNQPAPQPSPAAAPPSGAQGGFQDGQTATGPGGQKIIFQGGQWQPISQ